MNTEAIDRLIENVPNLIKSREALETMKEGVYCIHRSWGFGKITGFDTSIDSSQWMDGMPDEVRERYAWEWQEVIRQTNSAFLKEGQGHGTTKSKPTFLLTFLNVIRGRTTSYGRRLIG